MSSGSDFVTLQQRLQDQTIQDKPLKRKYESSSSHYDGPIIVRKGNRYGFPVLSSNNLVRTEAVPANHPRIGIWTQAKQEAAALVDEEGVAFDSISVLMRRESGDSQSSAAIIINTPNLDHRDKWNSVLVSIARMLYTIKALDMHVEISFFEPEIEKRIYAIPWNHSCVSVWNESVRDKVLSHLEDSPWNTVSVFLYGQDLLSAKPTIIITTTDINHSTWITVQEQLSHSVLQNSDLDLQVVEDHLIGAYQSHNNLGYRSQREYRVKLAMGHSIGVESDGGGTIGGFIRLRSHDNQLSTVYALTNYHVVRGSRLDWPEDLDEGRGKFDMWPKDGRIVYGPAPSDYRSELETLDQSIAAFQNKTKISPLAMKVLYGSPNDIQKAQHKANEEELASYEERKKILKEKKDSLNFGCVMMGSGYRVTPFQSAAAQSKQQCALDWALIAVGSSRVDGNRVSNELQDFLVRASLLIRTQLPEKDHFGGEPSGIFNKANRKQVPAIDRSMELLGSDYFKIGRTSGLTTGTTNGIATLVTLSLPLNDSDKPPYPGIDQRRKRLTEEYTIVSNSKRHDARFLEEGDSGAWILDNLGNLAGLAWGASNDGRSAYVTPIGYIIAGIEARLKKKVELYQL